MARTAADGGKQAAAADEPRQRGMAGKAAQWTRTIATQRRSGLPVAEFCRRRGLAKATFWYWRKRLQLVLAQPAVVTPPAQRFLALPLVPPVAEHVEVDFGALRVRLEGTAATRVVDAIIARLGNGGQQ